MDSKKRTSTSKSHFVKNETHFYMSIEIIAEWKRQGAERSVASYLCMKSGVNFLLCEHVQELNSAPCFRGRKWGTGLGGENDPWCPMSLGKGRLAPPSLRFSHSGAVHPLVL